MGSKYETWYSEPSGHFAIYERWLLGWRYIPLLRDSADELQQEQRCTYGNGALLFCRVWCQLSERSEVRSDNCIKTKFVRSMVTKFSEVFRFASAPSRRRSSIVFRSWMCPCQWWVFFYWRFLFWKLTISSITHKVISYQDHSSFLGKKKRKISPTRKLKVLRSIAKKKHTHIDCNNMLKNSQKSSRGGMIVLFWEVERLVDGSGTWCFVWSTLMTFLLGKVPSTELCAKIFFLLSLIMPWISKVWIFNIILHCSFRPNSNFCVMTK